VVIIEP